MHFILASITILFTVCFQIEVYGTEGEFFRQHFKTINDNIDDELFEENIALIQKLVQLKEYQTLDCYQKGKILNKLGVSYFKLQMDEDALRLFKDSVLSIWQNCSKVPLVEKANTMYNIGISYQYLGNIIQAKQYLDKALYIFETDSSYPPEFLADNYHGMGNFYHDQYDAFRSELYYKNALNIYQKITGTAILKFRLLNDLVTMYMDFKRYTEAKTYIEQAMDIYQKYPEDIANYDLSLILLNAGITYFELEEYTLAWEKGQEALKLISKKEDPQNYSIALELLAFIEAEENKFDDALHKMKDVINLRYGETSSWESKKSIALAYENYCDILLKNGAIKEAEEYLNLSFDELLLTGSFDANHVPIVQNFKAIDDTYLIRLIEFKVKIFEKRFEDSGDIQHLKEALSLQHKIDSVINRDLVSLQFESSKLDFLDLIFEYYGKAVEDALILYRLTNNSFFLEDAYYFSSKTKAIVLQQELNQADAFQTIISPEILRKEEALREEMYEMQGLLLEADSNENIYLQKYVQAQQKLDVFLEDIEKNEPVYFQKRYAFINPPKLATIQPLIPNNMAIVEYFYTTDTIYSFWITKDAFFPISISNNKTLRNNINTFSSECRDPNKNLSSKVAKLLYQKCLGVGLDKIDRKLERLCIIPDGFLHTLPFEALMIPENKRYKFLVEDYAISQSYAVKLLFKEKDIIRSGKYIGFGTNYTTNLSKKLTSRKRFFGDENLTQLVLSKEEINRGANIFGGQKFMDEDASVENFLTHSTDADIIHLSLHGLVDMDDPERSCILFDDSKEKFILSTLDLYAQKLNAELVLLSACHTASGKIYSGEGVQGISKAFLLSGARNIISSLWNATEASSIVIMTAFLKYMKTGKYKDVAIQRAKLDYLKSVGPNRRHPFYWANFILIGEVEQKRTSLIFPASFIIGAIIILSIFLAYKRKRQTVNN